MVLKSDRNLSHTEAVAAGLLSDYESNLSADLPFPIIHKRASDWGAKKDVLNGASMNADPSYDQSNSVQPIKQSDATLAKSMKTEAVKADAGKLDWSLVPFEALEGMVQVLEFGKKKYSAWNWSTNGGFLWTRLVSSTLRHLFAFARGDDLDPESGLSHISHAQCNLLFLAYYIRNKDDRRKDDRRKV